ncbi:LysM peptidoglycan-binding domain-containing protein [Allosalinactinospora lopnorensis]|uniref:LysM peptidoglycan-binding domain-containing protein n=1 Tax=Allosalinactinospora lopnorensis TaxID=1352348 RepID=UPI000623D1B4|nr:LysM peptidoglycan-binding domain-containing protein [Allosalinactinospora lopnorensis]
MTQHRSTPQRQQSAPVGFARGLAATALLVAIVLGIPALLLTFGGFPLPDRVPTWAEIADLLSRPDDGSLFIGVLTWVAWVAWLVLTVLIALEAITQLRGMPPIQLPGMGWLQVAVAGLVSPAIIGLSGGTANAEESPVVAVVAYQSPGGPAHQESQQEEDTDAQEADASDPATKQRLYTVQPGDSYWRIAENQLGDPERYTEIVAANKGRAMPDGTVLSGEEFLAPGWELLLPVADQEQHEPEDSSEETVHTVKAGETLSAIASEHLATPKPTLRFSRPTKTARNQAEHV